MLNKNGRFGYVDASGETAVPFVYDNTHAFSEGVAAVKKEGKWGFIDRSGGVCVPFVFDYASPFSEGIAVVNTEGQFRLLFDLLFDSYEGE